MGARIRRMAASSAGSVAWMSLSRCPIHVNSCASAPDLSTPAGSERHRHGRGAGNLVGVGGRGRAVGERGADPTIYRAITIRRLDCSHLTAERPSERRERSDDRLEYFPIKNTVKLENTLVISWHIDFNSNLSCPFSA
jgi:hypothetical protein